ncbi:unnamed protein product [Schistosoma mattheei]|uniref:Uncharacterized protein n=1 Tax=Schistosoma mattheei TaxID=31246 RepID=A0A183NVT7_9TREM|nr:unnamed protein product [Schistosoma mattheei]
MNSNPIIPETACANSDLSSSQKNDTLLNVHEIVAVTAHEERENESSSTLNADALNGAHHSVIEVSDESNYRDSLVLPENVSHASNDNKEPSAVFIDAVYPNDSSSTNEVFNKFDVNVSEESTSMTSYQASLILTT